MYFFLFYYSFSFFNLHNLKLDFIAKILYQDVKETFEVSGGGWYEHNFGREPSDMYVG
jgi:hypothetical protein